MNHVLPFSAGHLISRNATLDTHRLKLVDDIGETGNTTSSDVVETMRGERAANVASATSGNTR